MYHDVGLADAPIKRQTARKLLANGIDPSESSKDDKRVKATVAVNTFELVAREFQGGKDTARSPSCFDNWRRQLEKDVSPYVGKLRIANITTPMVLEVIRRREKRGVHDTIHPGKGPRTARIEKSWR